MALEAQKKPKKEIVKKGPTRKATVGKDGKKEVKPPPAPDKIRLIIKDAKFTKDFDGNIMTGKQDPRIDIKFGA